MMKLGTENPMADFEEKRSEFMNAINNNASQSRQNQLYGEMLEALADGLEEKAEMKAEEIVNSRFGMVNEFKPVGLSGHELVFYNELDKSVPEGLEKLIPEETIDRIFEDMKNQHPLLEKIGLVNTGLRLQIITSEHEGSATWGKIFGEIKGQLKASFGTRQEMQNKLTAFVVIPKDFQKFGPVWVESFIRLQLTEAFAVALESAFLNGDGNDKPIGLTRKLVGTGQAGAMIYDKKDKQGKKVTLESPRAIINQVTDIFKYHSVKADGKQVDPMGKVVLVLNPEEYWEVEKALTSFNDNAEYKRTVPLGLQIISSTAQEKGYATSFIQGRYDAFVGGGIEIKRYPETFAMEDLDLFIAKQFAFGKAHDDKTSAIWELDFSKVSSGV